MHITLVQSLDAFLQANPAHGHWMTFIIACLESIAIIGSLIPGSITMTAIGSLIGNGTLDFQNTLLFAIAGALIGDLISYWLGLHFSPYFRNLSWVQKRKHWLEKSEHFFEKYGIISLIIGRFFGPMRSMLPMIAGFCKMKPLPFLCGAIPSAILWATIYLIPGVILGILSSQFPQVLSFTFILKALLHLALLFIFYYLIRKLFLKLNLLLKQMAERAHQSETLTWYQGASVSDTYDIMMSITYALLFSSLFLYTGWQVQHQGWLTFFNLPLYHLLQSMHTPFWNPLIQKTTFFADKYALIYGCIALSIGLFLTQQRKEALHWTLSCVGSILVIKSTKLFYLVARPPIMLHILGHSSFPSGHVSFAALIVFSLTMLSRNNHRYTQPIVNIAHYWLGWTAFTRLYLGAHWLTDVLGALFIAAALANTSHFFLKKYRINTYRITPSISVCALILWLSSGFILIHKKFDAYYHNAFPPAKTLKIKNTHLWYTHPDILATTHQNRLCTKSEQLNVQWASPSLKHIHTQLIQDGWQIETPFHHNWIGNVYQILSDPKRMQLKRILPPLFEQKAPSLVARKTTKDQLYRLELWETHTTIEDQCLFLGSLYHIKQDGATPDVHPLTKSHPQAFVSKETNILQIYEQHRNAS